MKVGYIQFNPVFGEKRRNVNTILKLLDEGVRQGSDLIVLPELCNTGYVFRSKEELKTLSEVVPEGETTEVLATFAREKRVYVVAGVCEREKGKFFNSAILVGPNGFMGVYRKAHLFNQEKRYFSMGDSPFTVYDVSKAKIGIMICFDWFFPEVIRILALKGAHLICHPANLVLPYCQTALLGAAIQNKIYIITANRIGVERGVRFTGGSQILHPNMKILSKSDESEEVKVIEIDIKQAENKKITEYNDLWDDRRIDLFYPLVTWGANP